MKQNRTLKSLESLIKEGLKVFNENNVEASKYVKEGRTKVVEDKSEAELLAGRSYFYEIFDENRNPLGYAIPK